MALRNFQSQDFWAMIFARPLTILFLLPICNTQWVTPNLLTVLSILTKLGGVALLFWGTTYSTDVLAAVAVNLGLVLDNMDGTLARYRNCGTCFGYYLDKASDAITLTLIFWAMAYHAYLSTQDIWDLVLPLMATGGVLVAGYVKWVGDKAIQNCEITALQNDPQKLQDWVNKHVNHNPSTPPPTRGPLDWLRFFGKALFSILYFNEVDLYFWLAVALITSKYWVFTKMLCPILIVAVLLVPVIFAFKVNRAERHG